MAIPHIKKILGHDFNFYNSTSVSWTQFGAPDGYTLIDGYGPDLAITFSTQGIMFTNETSGQVVEYSFNGSTVHGVLDGTATSTTRVVMFNSRVVSLIWFRLKTGSAGPATITTTAWGIR
jgi:hypothetical protein